MENAIYSINKIYQDHDLKIGVKRISDSAALFSSLDPLREEFLFLPFECYFAFRATCLYSSILVS